MLELTIQDALVIIGGKEVELFFARERIAKATEIMKSQQAKIAELEQKLHDLTADNASDAKGVPDAV